MVMDKVEDMMDMESDPNNDSLLLDGLDTNRSSPARKVSKQSNERLKQAEKLLTTNLENMASSQKFYEG